MFVSLWPFVMIMNGDKVDALDSGRDGWNAMQRCSDAMDGCAVVAMDRCRMD
jgi:hypothetical protein